MSSPEKQRTDYLDNPDLTFAEFGTLSAVQQAAWVERYPDVITSPTAPDLEILESRLLSPLDLKEK